MAIWDDVIPAEEQATYRAAGWGGRVGYGESPALVVVDMCNSFVDASYPFASPAARKAVPFIQRLLNEFRAAKRPVFFSTAKIAETRIERGLWKANAFDRAELRRPEAWEIWQELKPIADEPVIRKTYPSVFFGTSFVSQLLQSRVDTLVVTGTVTSGCVRGTCLDAFNYHLRVVVPEEAVCDRGAVSHKVALFEIQMKYGDVVSTDEVVKYIKGLPQPSVGNSAQDKRAAL
jgi:maleamate amidohydrolase